MAIDNDLSALLPDPPPPRPAQREAAIGEALRRFDGRGHQAPPPRTGARPAPARGGWGRPQIAALASVTLVVLVSVPLWWAERDRPVPGAPPVPPEAARAPSDAGPAPVPPASQQSAAAGPGSVQAAPTAPALPATNAPPAAPPSDVTGALAAAPPADARSPSEAVGQASARQVSAPAQVAAAARPAPAARAESEGAIVVTGARVQRQDFNSTTPMVIADEALLSQSSTAVGDWDTCTLHDPRRDASACRAFADQGAGRAAEPLTDGLALAWQGELDRAIDAFDRAIGAAPDLSIAYLNRGLAYQAKGDLRRALADLDRAVARDRTGARGYYHRSQLHRARGDTADADADARKAIQLDPAYRAVLP